MSRATRLQFCGSGSRKRLAKAARALREGPGDVEALDELDQVVEEIGVMVGLYEQVLSQRGIRRPY